MKPKLDWLKKTKIFAVNREPVHSDHLCTVDGQQLKQSLNAHESLRMQHSPVQEQKRFSTPVPIRRRKRLHTSLQM